MCLLKRFREAQKNCCDGKNERKKGVFCWNANVKSDVLRSGSDLIRRRRQTNPSLRYSGVFNLA